MRRWTFALLIGLLPLAFFVWVALSADRPSPAEATTGPASRTAPVAAGADRLTPALRAQLAALDHIRGAALSEATLMDKVVLVTFFASWCAPCRKELMHLAALRREWGPRGLEVVAVNLFEEFDGLSDRRRLDAYLNILQPEFPVVAGTDEISLAFGHIRRIPTLLIYGRDGRRQGLFVNARGAPASAMDLASLRAAVSPLL